jgi:hypothetical protein
MERSVAAMLRGALLREQLFDLLAEGYGRGIRRGGLGLELAEDRDRVGRRRPAARDEQPDDGAEHDAQQQADQQRQYGVHAPSVAPPADTAAQRAGRVS